MVKFVRNEFKSGSEITESTSVSSCRMGSMLTCISHQFFYLEKCTCWKLLGYSFQQAESFRELTPTVVGTPCEFLPLREKFGLIQKIHRLPSRVIKHPNYPLLKKLRLWLLSPVTLWPINLDMIGHRLVDALKTGKLSVFLKQCHDKTARSKRG